MSPIAAGDLLLTQRAGTQYKAVTGAAGPLANAQPTDLFLVQRAGTQYKVPYSALNTVQDTDLVLVQRGATQYKATGAEVKAWLGGTVTPPAGDPWTPAELPGVDLWFDAEDTNSIVLNGQNVSSWTSRGAQKVTAAQGNTANQPLLETVNGKKFIGRGSVDSNLSMTGLAGDIDYIMVVLDTVENIPASAYSGIFVLRGGVLGLVIEYSTPGGTNVYLTGDNGAAMPGLVAAFNYASVTDLANLGNYATGVPIGRLGVSVLEFQMDEYRYNSPYKFDIAGDTVAAGRGLAKGRIAQIITATIPPSVSDRQKMEGWSAHAYGLAADLPANHPYKNAPPTK